jgi:hypothetical protein
MNGRPGSRRVLVTHSDAPTEEVPSAAAGAKAQARATVQPFVIRASLETGHNLGLASVPNDRTGDDIAFVNKTHTKFLDEFVVCWDVDQVKQFMAQPGELERRKVP